MLTVMIEQSKGGDGVLPNNIPLGISQVHDKNNHTTQVSFSYIESADIEYFEMQYWNDDERKWLPYDGRTGIIPKK